MGAWIRPSPVAYTVIVSPEMAGLLLVTCPVLAQQSAALVAVNNSLAPLLTDAEYVIPCPDAPDFRANNRTRVNAPAADAETFGSLFTAATRPSTTVESASVLLTL